MVWNMRLPDPSLASYSRYELVSRKYTMIKISVDHGSADGRWQAIVDCDNCCPGHHRTRPHPRPKKETQGSTNVPRCSIPKDQTQPQATFGSGKKKTTQTHTHTHTCNNTVQVQTCIHECTCRCLYGNCMNAHVSAH